MTQVLSEPIELRYKGLDADKGQVDAFYLGESLQGVSRVYNSVSHFYFHSEVPKRLIPKMRVQVGPPKEGSLSYLLYIILNPGLIPAYPDLLLSLAGELVPAFIKALFAEKAGMEEQLDKALEIIQEQSRQEHELSKLIFEGQQVDKDNLMSIIKMLNERNSVGLRDMVSPVGKSVRSITHCEGGNSKFIIDEPVAEVFREKEEAVVGEETIYITEIVAVDLVTGTCKLKIEGHDKPLKGKVTDPLLNLPGNIYTHALDTSEKVQVTGKPVIMKGDITTLYISNAKSLNE